MSVATTKTFSGPYLADGVVSAFPFDFQALDPEDVGVLVRDIAGSESVYDPDYFSVSLSEEGGTVTLQFAPAEGLAVYVYSDPSFLQTIKFENGSNWLAEPVNIANDRAAVRALALKREVEQSIRAPLGEALGKLPPAAVRAGGVIKFNDDTGEIEVKPEAEFAPGPPGPSNNTRVSLAALKGAATSDKTSLYDGSLWTWTTGDYSGTPADKIDVIVVESDSTPLSVGAWVRQESASVTFDARRNVEERLKLEVFVTDARYAGGASGNGIADDTPAFLACAAECEITGATMRIPCGTYRLTDTIPVRRSFSIVGDGTERTLIRAEFATQKPVFAVTPANNNVVLGGRYADMQIICNGGSVPADGVIVHSGPVNSTIRQCHFDNLWIRDCRRGVDISGVIYRNFFTNITVQGTSDYGFYSDAGFIDVTYNTFAQLEVTNIGNGAWAYFVKSAYSTFDTLTADGPAYFFNPAGELRNYTCEAMHPDTFPVEAGAVLTADQVQVIDGFTIRAVPPEKFSVALRINGVSVVNGMRMVAPHPINALLLNPGSAGVINTLQVEGPINQIEQTHSDEILNRWVFNSCYQVTRRSMRYEEGAWTPVFAGWTVNPTVNISGTIYERIGNRVFVTMRATGGVADPGATIGGLPVPTSPFSTGVVTFSSTDPAKRIENGDLGPASTAIGAFGAVDMTGADWTMVAEYRA